MDTFVIWLPLRFVSSSTSFMNCVMEMNSNHCRHDMATITHSRTRVILKSISLLAFHKYSCGKIWKKLYLCLANESQVAKVLGQ